MALNREWAGGTDEMIYAGTASAVWNWMFGTLLVVAKATDATDTLAFWHHRATSNAR